VRLVWSGIRCAKGAAQAHQKSVLTKHIRAMVEHLPDGLSASVTVPCFSSASRVPCNAVSWREGF